MNSLHQTNSLRSDTFLLFQMVKSWFKTNVLNLIIAIFTFYAVFVREVKVYIFINPSDLSLQNSTAGLPQTVADASYNWNPEKAATTPTKPQKTNKAEAAVGPVKFKADHQKAAPKASAITSASSAKPVEKKDPKDGNRANSFANISFVLSPGLKDKVPAEIYAAKMKNCRDYVKHYAEIAVTEKNKSGIPASITLAQGLLESDAGGSRLSRLNRNHFGVKCFSRHCKRGHCSNFSDDTHKDFFKIYKNVWESYRDHSNFLKTNRYKKLFSLAPTDYKGWAKGLQQAGYATDKQYASKIILIIETLQLQQYDK